MIGIDCVIAEVKVLRLRQDVAHGGPAHDDTHNRYSWTEFVQKFLKRAESASLENPERAEDYERNMLDVAALAVAAIQSSRRKRACTCQSCEAPRQRETDKPTLESE